MAKATPPVSTVTMASSPSSTVAGLTVRVKSAVSLSKMVTFRVPISAPSWLAASVIVSLFSTWLSSIAVMVALPEVWLAASMMLAGAT